MRFKSIKQICQLHARIVRTHERFANKESMNLMVAHALDIIARADRLFGDHEFVRRDAR